MGLFGHHATGVMKSIGLEIEVNDKPFPDGPTEHVVVLVVLVFMLILMSYGVFAIIRDLVRLGRRKQEPITRSQEPGAKS